MLSTPDSCLPIAVVEAKAEDLEPGAGLQQAKDYAQNPGHCTDNKGAKASNE